MRFGDYDPRPEKEDSKNTAEIRESEKAVVQGIKRIEWLEEQGLELPRRRRSKKVRSSRNLRSPALAAPPLERKTGIGSSSGNGGGSSSSAGMPKTGRPKAAGGHHVHVSGSTEVRHSALFRFRFFRFFFFVFSCFFWALAFVLVAPLSSSGISFIRRRGILDVGAR